MTTAIVPMTRLDWAKSRLADVLDGETRRRLVLTMFADVLGALAACRLLDRVTVVTPDPRIAEFAAMRDAEVISEAPQHGLNAAIATALAQVRAAGAPRVLIVPGDIPLATPGELSDVIAALDDGADVVVVPAHDGFGTNALAFCGSRPLAPMFGARSHRCHLAQARALGVTARGMRLPGIGRDVDTPGDLCDLVSRDASGRYAFLRAVLATASPPNSARACADSKETAS